MGIRGALSKTVGVVAAGVQLGIEKIVVLQDLHVISQKHAT